MRISTWTCVFAVVMFAITTNASGNCPVKHPCTCSERESEENGKVITLIDIVCSRNGAQELPKVYWQLTPDNVKVDKFTFSYNTISTLKNDSFTVLTPRIIDITESSVTNIEMGAFNGLEGRLEVLDVASNDRLMFPKSLLSTLTSLRTLDLSGTTVSSMNHESYFNNPPFFVSTSLEKLSMRESSIENMNIKFFTGLVNLKYLDMYNNDLFDMPKAITKCYNLERLDISKNSIDDIPNGFFKKLNKLKWLSLSMNYLDDYSFKRKTFDGLQNTLEELLMNETDISSIPKVAISGLHKLRILDVCETGLRSVKEGDFEGLKSLEELRICEIRNDVKVRKGAFKEIKSTLKVLSLAAVDLTRVPTEAIGELHNLVELDLSGNNLSRLSSADFEGLTSLTILGLAFNRHLTIDDDAFKFLESTLLELDLYSLRIEVIPKAVRALKSLKKLNLAENIFVHVDADFFDGIHASNIIMHHCQIKNINGSAFANLYSRTHRKIEVDLSHNEIKSLDFIEKSELFSAVNIEHEHGIECGCHEFLLASCPNLTIKGVCNTPTVLSGERVGSEMFMRELGKTCSDSNSSYGPCPKPTPEPEPGTTLVVCDPDTGGPGCGSKYNNSAPSYVLQYLSVLFCLVCFSTTMYLY